MEEDRGFLGDGTLTCHQTFPLPWTRLGGQFAGNKGLTNTRATLGFLGGC